jgi:hypothetical protein
LQVFVDGLLLPEIAFKASSEGDTFGVLAGHDTLALLGAVYK